MKELSSLFRVILERKNSPVENSYTSYLFDKGLDKILKKCGEECSEMIIAAKSLEYGKNLSDKQSDLENEICDLIYHIEVLMAFFDITPDNIDRILKERSLKIGNLKSVKDVDLNS